MESTLQSPPQFAAYRLRFTMRCCSIDDALTAQSPSCCGHWNKSQVRSHRRKKAARGGGGRHLVFAKKMLRLSPNVRSLLNFPFRSSTALSSPSKRQPGGSSCVSTIESCYYLIRELRAAALVSARLDPDPLMAVFRRMVTTFSWRRRAQPHRREIPRPPLLMRGVTQARRKRPERRRWNIKLTPTP